VLFIVNESDHRDRWRGIHDAEWALIVQRDISARNGRSERVACFSHAFNGFTQLPKVFRFVRVSKIQTIRNGERARAGTG
jgi:hypothetical protein